METARKAGVGITPEANAKAAKGVPFGNPVKQVGNLLQRLGKATSPKPAYAGPVLIGNSSMDRHNARASEFALSEEDRAKQLRRLDRMRAQKP